MRYGSCRWPSLPAVVIAIAILAQEGTSEASNPPYKQYYWDNSMGSSVTMWPIDQGYCFLTEIAVGYALNDQVSVQTQSGNWVLVGTSSGPLHEAFGVATCVPWPAGFSVPFSNYWQNSDGGSTLSPTSCFCSIAGLTYNGSIGMDVPDFIIDGYQYNNVMSTVGEHIQTDNMTSPRHQMMTNCMCPNNGPGNYFYGGTTNTMTKTSGLFNMAHDLGPGPQICGFEEGQLNNSSALAWSISPPTDSSMQHWGGRTEAPNGELSVACIPYPGPVVQMDCGAAGVPQALGPDWSADGNFSGNTFTPSTGNIITLTGQTRPAPSDVYKTARGALTGNLTYTFSGYAKGSTHTIRFHFVESWLSGINARVFQIKVNGAVFQSVDIWKLVGSNHALVLDHTFVADSSTGNFVIQFVPTIDLPIVSGIEIQ